MLPETMTYPYFRGKRKPSFRVCHPEGFGFFQKVGEVFAPNKERGAKDTASATGKEE